MDSLITQTMSTLGLLGVGVLMFLENVFPPIPSELIMPLAGYAAARGDMSLVGVVVAGTIGSVLGQFPLYYLGRAVGEQRLHDLANRYGKWITVSGAEVTRAGEWLRRRGTLAVFVCRLIPGLRSLISIPAGASGMNLMLFTSCSTLGIALWSTLLASLGYLLGENYHRVEETIGRFSQLIWITLAAAILAWIAWRIRGCFVHARVDCPFHESS